MMFLRLVSSCQASTGLWFQDRTVEGEQVLLRLVNGPFVHQMLPEIRISRRDWSGRT